MTRHRSPVNCGLPPQPPRTKPDFRGGYTNPGYRGGQRWSAAIPGYWGGFAKPDFRGGALTQCLHSNQAGLPGRLHQTGLPGRSEAVSSQPRLLGRLGERISGKVKGVKGVYIEAKVYFRGGGVSIKLVTNMDRPLQNERRQQNIFA